MDCLSLDSGLGLSPTAAAFPGLSPAPSPLSANFPGLSPMPSPLSANFPDLRASCASLMDLVKADKAITAARLCQQADSTRSSSGLSSSQDDVPSLRSRTVMIDMPRVLERPEMEAIASRLERRPSTKIESSRRRAEELHYAIDRKDSHAVFELLEDVDKGTNPNASRPGSPLTPLQRALATGSVPIAIYLVLAGAFMEARNLAGETALISAVRQGFPDDFIALMCELGADPTAVDNTGRSALHHAAELSPSDSTILALAGHGADMELQDGVGHTPLLEAVSFSRLGSTRQLINCGADLEVATPGGKTLLGVAITKRSAGIVRVLCQGGVQVDRRTGESTPLLAAITAGCTDIAEVLIKAGADLNKRGSKLSTPLLMAAALGNQLVAEVLLEKGADVRKCSKSGNTPLHMAAQNGHVEIAQMLAKADAPIDATNAAGGRPLDLAVVMGHASVVKALLACGADASPLSPDRESMLWCALKWAKSSGEGDKKTAGRIEIVRMLIEEGGDLYRPQGRLNLTPLHQAARLGLDGIIELMLSKGAQADATIWGGHTPLFFAAEGGQLSTLRLLIDKHNADIHARTTADDTLLFAAASAPEVLRFLLGLRVRRSKKLAGLGSRPAFDVNHQNKRGATALHYAASMGSYEAVKLLLQKGAKQFLAHAVYDNLEDYREEKNYRQGTPAGLARQRGHDRVAELLDTWRYK